MSHASKRKIFGFGKNICYSSALFDLFNLLKIEEWKGLSRDASRRYGLVHGSTCRTRREDRTRHQFAFKVSTIKYIFFHYIQSRSMIPCLQSKDDSSSGEHEHLDYISMQSIQYLIFQSAQTGGQTRVFKWPHWFYSSVFYYCNLLNK